ncbi:MAG TPA: hypothetical protein VN131_00615, partial [Mobilitalea sp.]|nr:hypothetical protein [Mobilitalea sp.]
MEIVNKIIGIAFSTILFCIAVFLLISYSDTYHKTLTSVRANYKEDVLYQQYSTGDESVVSYEKLIATLFNTLDYDIEINGIRISKANHE